MTPPSARPPHLRFVDTIRGIAAFYVVVHHASAYVERSPDGVLNGLLKLFSYGHYAVDIFITLSGFCLALPIVLSGGVLRGGTIGFLKRRARRILPPYFASMIICLLLIVTILPHGTGTVWDIAAKVTPFGVLAAALLIQDFFVWWVGGQINYPFWSVAIEWHIYFIYPIIVWLEIRLGKITTLLFFIVAPIGAAYSLRDSLWAGLYIQFIGLFSMGAAAAYVVFSTDYKMKFLRERFPWLLALMIFSASALALCLLLPGSRWIRNWAIADAVCGAATASLLIYLSHRPHSQVLSALEWQPFVILGAFSYSLYLVHAPALQLVWTGLRRSWPLAASNVIFLTVAVPACLALSWLFYRAFERPFLRPTAAGRIKYLNG